MRWMLWMVVGVGGCTAHEVRCDTHLQAINKPAPRSVDASGGIVSGARPDAPNLAPAVGASPRNTP